MKINCFIPVSSAGDDGRTPGQLSGPGPLSELAGHGLVNRVYVWGSTSPGPLPEGCGFLKTDDSFSTDTIQKIADHSTGVAYSLLVTGGSPVTFGMFALHRFCDVAESTGRGICYSDYYDKLDGTLTPHPLIDYQAGSLRDDFGFGPVLFFRSSALIRAAESLHENYRFAGLYRLRLSVSRDSLPLRIPEMLYTVLHSDTRTPDSLFDYVDPRNREVQIEMERAVTGHLKELGGFLGAGFGEVRPDEGEFPVEASVIIPVRNRERTIADAVGSALSQEASFSYNVIVVDNHSTDGTTGILAEVAGQHAGLIHLVPGRDDLGIGGCWNLAVHHPGCGRFAVQLDSDDLYSDSRTLERIVQAFRRERCAMVIGTYRMTDFNLQEIPPGIIDHREWTPDNGPNNALRINGLGAPRAFYTPVLREIRIPNVNYGEDYAAVLAVCRRYRVGRIYEPLYLCRRWEDNTDASLSTEAGNRHNLYKDRIRTIELEARIRLNSAGK